MSQAQEPIPASGKKKSTKAKPLMGQKATSTRSTQPRVVSQPSVGKSPEPVQEEKGDLVTELWLRFSRFGWDVAGLGLIAFALITLIGLISRSQDPEWARGAFISVWAHLIAIGFGWGWPLVVVSIVLLSVLCFRRRVGPLPKINLARVLALEGLAFSLLAFLALAGGWSLENAEAGQDGGVIGWGLAILLDRVLPVPWSSIFLIGLMVLLFGYGTGLMVWIVKRLERWLNTINPPGEAAPSEGGVPSKMMGVRPAEYSGDLTEEDDPPPQVPAGQRVRNPELPPLDLLLNEQNIRPEDSYIQETAQQIVNTLGEFGVPVAVLGFRVGPTVTQYAVEPGFIEKTGPDGEPLRQKVRVSQISALQRDLALALSAERLRIEAPVPGRSYVGIEVPNPLNSVVRMRPLLECEEFYKLSSPLAVALGKDVSGQPLVADLARMPHLLIAGTTGSGKSVCIGAIVTCLVVNNPPSDLRIALLDPKMVELVRFNGLPHLFGRVETELERMLGVLRWALAEMDRRYRLLEDAHSRDIISYNRKMEKRGQPKLPRIVLLIDELADLMMTAPDQTEHSLIRLAQMARATGMHLVVATQRPSTDVVTGLIKANFPARLAFSVASSIDSRVILDGSGAESLLGKGDMLFLNPEAGTPLRAQGAMVSDSEIDAVLAFWKQKTADSPQNEAPPWEELLLNPEEEDSDKLVEQAVKIVRATQRASTSLLQRRLRIGYPRAARLMDELEELGVVGPSQGGGREREVLEPPEMSSGDNAETDSAVGDS
jgi:DNA segregation ATPase FtsK/SpoIIIE, S-DNA-T family